MQESKPKRKHLASELITISILHLHISPLCIHLYLLIWYISGIHISVSIPNHPPCARNTSVNSFIKLSTLCFRGVSTALIGICRSDCVWVHLIGLVSMWLTHVALYLPFVIDEPVLVVTAVTQASADKWLTSMRAQKHFAVRCPTEKDIDCERSMYSLSHGCLMT